MTRVVYALLALNLILLTWNLQTRPASDVTPGPSIEEQSAGEVNQLPLLTELSADALRPRVTAPAQSTREVAQAIVPPPTVDPVDNESTSAVTTPAVEGADLQAPKVVDNAATAVESSAAPVIDAASSALAARACLTLGPLSADAPVGQMSAWLQSAGATVDVRTDERREVALYWVFFPPRSSREQATAEVERLRGEGVTDVIAVPKGDMANAISLGVFSRTDSRDRRVKEMNQRGYQPSVAPRYRVKLASWIDVNAPVDVLTDEELQTRWPNVEVSRKPCVGKPLAVIRQGAPTPGPLERIAQQRKASYNANPPTPRRYHFSGADASR